ncbi:unnamed protein product [Phaeothamnion confervicola]
MVSPWLRRRYGLTLLNIWAITLDFTSCATHPTAPERLKRETLAESIASAPMGCPLLPSWNRSSPSKFDGASYYNAHQPIDVVGLFDYRATEEQIDVETGRPVTLDLLHVYHQPEFNSDENPGIVAIFRNAFVTNEWTHVYDCRIRWLAGGCKVHPHPGDAWTKFSSADLTPKRRRNLDGIVVNIFQLWGTGTYHFLIESFPRIAHVHQFLLDNPMVRVLVPAAPRPLADQMFRLIGIDPSRLVRKDRKDNFFVETLLVPTPTACGRASRPALQAIKTLLRKGVVAAYYGGDEPQRDPHHRHIVVQQRSPGGHRSVTNHDQLVEALRAAFPTATIDVYKADDSLETCIRKHFLADLVVGPHGAGLSNVLFTPPSGFGVIEVHPSRGNGVDASGPLFINTCHMHSALRAGGLYRSLMASMNKGGVSGPMTVDATKIVAYAKDLFQELDANRTAAAIAEKKEGTHVLNPRSWWA